MKNIQVIDDADNCAYSIFAIEEDGFNMIFPGEGQDIEFASDFFERVGEEIAREVLEPAWKNRVDKQKVQGIHGTLFYNLDFKKEFYRNKRESDFDLKVEV